MHPNALVIGTRGPKLDLCSLPGLHTRRCVAQNGRRACAARAGPGHAVGGICGKQRSDFAVAQGALASLSVELYDRMKQAAHNNFEKALEFLDPLGWMWQHGLAQHLEGVQGRGQGARPDAQGSGSQEQELPLPRSAQDRNPQLAGRGSLEFLIVDTGPDARAELPNASRPALGA